VGEYCSTLFLKTNHFRFFVDLNKINPSKIRCRLSIYNDKITIGNIVNYKIVEHFLKYPFNIEELKSFKDIVEKYK